MGKTDTGGSFAYVCDGASPGSPVLWDGYAVYTPGLSENRGGNARYTHADMLGSLVMMTNPAQQPINAAQYDGFGAVTALWGQTPSVTPFKFGGANGCQTDADTGLILMGYRFYDSRTGRFLSQDPAKSGGNWYAYAGNNPVNKKDPTGLRQIDAPSPGDSRFGSDPGGLFGGAGMLDDFFANEDVSSERAQEGYWADEAAKALAAQVSSSGAQITLALDKGRSAFGFIMNQSLEPIVIEFDKDIQTATHPNGIETLWRVTLAPGFESSPTVVDVDFVLLPKSQGGFWAHLYPWVSYQAVDLLNGQQAIVPGIFRKEGVDFGLFPKASGYPYFPSFISGTAGAYNRGFVRRNSPNFGFPLAPSI